MCCITVILISISNLPSLPRPSSCLWRLQHNLNTHFLTSFLIYIPLPAQRPQTYFPERLSGGTKSYIYMFYLHRNICNNQSIDTIEWDFFGNIYALLNQDTFEQAYFYSARFNMLFCVWWKT